MVNFDFQSKQEILNAFPDETSCIAHLEQLRWNGLVCSPFDSLSTVYNCKNNKYRCKNTGKYFNVKTGTMFHNSKIELQKWFIAIWILSRRKRALTSVEFAEELQVTQKTAWYLQKRIENYLQLDKAKKVKKKKTKKNKKAINVAQITVVPDNDRLPMHEWLQLLKK